MYMYIKHFLKSMSKSECKIKQMCIYFIHDYELEELQLLHTLIAFEKILLMDERVINHL